MSKLSLLSGAFLLVAALALLVESRAVAAPNCKKCNTGASCTHGCIRTQTDPPPAGPGFVCYEAKAHPNAGKVCGDGVEGDECHNDTTVFCAETWGKPCNGSTTVDCSGGGKIGVDEMQGCGA